MGEFLYPEAFQRFSVSLNTSLLSHFKTYTHAIIAVGDRILVHQTKKAPILSWCFAHRKELEPFIAYYFMQERKPARRSPDLKSGVKKCPNLFRLCGFEIRSKGVCFLLLGDYKSPGFNRSNIF